MTEDIDPPDNNRPLWFILLVIVLLCAVGGSILVRQYRMITARHRAVRAVIVLTGSAATLDLGHGATLKVVRIPAGKFLMGSNDNDPEADISEMDANGKKHSVTIAKPFYMGQTEVTREQYQAVMGYDSSAFKDANKYPDVATNMQLPADQVSWGDAQKWCVVVSERTGLKVRLPSEAEWEYACRAGTDTAFSSGDTLSRDVAQFDDGLIGEKPHSTAPVATHKPNAFGLYDMHGNVSEWVQDNFHPDYTGAPGDGSVWTNSDTPWLRVHRGGSYNNKASTERSAMREAGGSETEPELRASTIGFRVVVGS